MNASEVELRERFERALLEAGAGRSGGAAFDELCERYQEPHRHYHTLEHVDACLTWLDWFSASARHPAEVELALFFHDALYDPRRLDNEQQSARLAEERLTELGVPRAAVVAIAESIQATERHLAVSPDAALVLDLDLAILAAARRDFDRFEARIRREYAHVPDAAFRAGRRAVLEGFLSRPAIYVTPVIRSAFEARARENLGRRIKELSDEPVG